MPLFLCHLLLSFVTGLRFFNTMQKFFTLRVEFHYNVSLFSVDFICMQESKVCSSLSLKIYGYLELRSARINSRSASISPNDSVPGVGVVIFTEPKSFAEFSDFLSLLDTYSNIFLKALLFLSQTSMLLLFAPFQPIIKPTSFSFCSPFSKNFFMLENFNYH